jgi:hypothetical protein
MNHYTSLLLYLKELLKSDPLINTITQGDFSKVALNKTNIYTLAHIVIGDPFFTNGQTVGFNLEVAVIDAVLTNLDNGEDSFFNSNNEVDVYNETLAVLNRFWTSINHDFEDKGIKAPDNCTLRQWLSDKDSAVGYVLTFTVELPNSEMILS